MQDQTKNTLGFASYDFSNSGYVLIFQSFLFPIYFIAVYDGVNLASSAIWAWMVAISSLVAIIISPILGKYADYKGRAKIFIILVAVTGLIASTNPLIFKNNTALLILSFIIFNSLFELSQTIYDSFLKNVATDHKSTISISSFAWGFGYLGGALFAVLYLLFEKTSLAQPKMFFIFGLLFILFSIPAIRLFLSIDVKRAIPLKGDYSLKPSAPVSWRQLFIYWIIAECVSAILYFVAIYVKQEIGLSITTIGKLMLVTQILAFPLTILMGKLANKYGALTIIRLCIAIWGIVLIGLFLAKNIWHIVAIMFLVSFVIGSTQAILRAYYASNVKKEFAGEGFGFYAIAQKSASVLAPVLVGIVITLTGKIKFTFLILFFLILAALVLSYKLSIVGEENESTVI